ncbi:TetR/AcrR family transcriptional regulator [Streptomyces griseorubiginosus]|uniref:TetR/AcrR family transcriptional regulator n=1 Tax=Streptomyces griseorubiginosus TaxID=67304 RepID=UPI0036EB37D3
MGRPKGFEPDAVIAQAMETFWSKGYTDTSPADLVEATGVAKGSLYHSFGSKRQLFDKALDRYSQMQAERAVECLAQPGTAKERIRAYFALLMDDDLDGPVRRGCLAQNTVGELGGRDAEVARAVHRLQEGVIELFAARIRQGQRDGDVDEDVDAQAQAMLLQTTLAGLRVMARTFDRQTLHRIIDTSLAGL